MNTCYVPIFNQVNIYDALVEIISLTPIEINNDPKLLITSINTLSRTKIYFKNNKDFYSAFSPTKILFKKNSYSSFLHQSQRIIINYTQTLDDLFALVHESTHKALYKENQEAVYSLFNEMLAFYSELELCNYLQSTELSEEARKQVNNSLHYIYKLSKNAKLESGIYKFYRYNNPLTLEEYNYYFGDRNEYYKVNLDVFGKYIFSSIMAIYINEIMSNKDITKEEMKRLKKAIISLKFDEINSILQLDMNFKTGIYISDNSLIKLARTYKKGIKKYE